MACPPLQRWPQLGPATTAVTTAACGPVSSLPPVPCASRAARAQGLQGLNVPNVCDVDTPHPISCRKPACSEPCLFAPRPQRSMWSAVSDASRKRLACASYAKLSEFPTLIAATNLLRFYGQGRTSAWHGRQQAAENPQHLPDYSRARRMPRASTQPSANPSVGGEQGHFRLSSVLAWAQAWALQLVRQQH